MGRPEQKQNQLIGKEGFFGKYREKVLLKETKKLQELVHCSGSRIFFDRIVNNWLDYLMWGIIIYVALTMWYPAVGQTKEITCNQISPDFCNSCFVYNNGLKSPIERETDLTKIGEMITKKGIVEIGK